MSECPNCGAPLTHDFYVNCPTCLEPLDMDVKPCVPIPCPPMEDIDLSGLVVMDVETFYREHPEGVFGDPDE